MEERTSPQHAPQQDPQRGSGLRRAARGVAKVLGVGLLVALLLLLALIHVVLYSNAALTFAVHTGLDLYSERIAGELRVAEVEGRLADSLALRGLVLVDAEGIEVVRVEGLLLEWEWSALLSRQLDVSSLVIGGATIDLRGDFADLTIPGPSAPKTTIGPSLPLELRADRIELRGLDMLGADGAPTLRAVHLTALDLAWSGTDASVQLTGGRGVLPGVIVEGIELGATWRDAVLHTGGEVVTDVGRLDLLGARVDVDRGAGELSLTTSLRPAPIAERWAPAPLQPWLARLRAAPQLALRGQLDPDGAASLGLSVDLPGLAEARVGVDGTLFEAPNLEVYGHVAVTQRALPTPALAPAGELLLALRGDLRGPSLESWESALRLLCVGCGEVGGLDLRLAASRGPARELEANLNLATLGVDLRAGASLLLPEPRGSAPPEAEQAGPRGAAPPDPEAAEAVELTGAQWELRGRSLARIVEGLEPLLDLPRLSGRLSSAGSCSGSPLRCEGVVGLGRGAGVGVELGSLRLEVEAEPLGAPLRATAAIAAREVRVEAADLTLAGVDAEAAVGPSDEEGAELAIDAELEAWVRARGAGDRATLAAVIHLGEALTVDLERLKLDYRGLNARLAAPARITAGDRRYAVDALDLRLAEGRLRADGVVDRDGPSDLNLDLDDLNLGRLAKLAPALRGRLRGRLSAEAKLEGAADRPTLRASATGRGLRLGRGRLGDVKIRAELQGGRAEAALDLGGDLAERARIEAGADVDLNLRSGRFALGPGSIRAEAELDALKLDRLEPWLAQIDPTLSVGGTLDLDAELSGPARSPSLTLEARGRGLRALGHEIGALDLKATLPRDRDAQLELRLARRGGVLIVDGQVLPIRLDLLDGGLRWLPRELHQLRVDATRITLRRQLEGLVDPASIPLTGVFDLDLELAGPMAGPMADTLAAELRLRGHRLAALGLELGDLDLRAEIDRERAIADLDLEGPLAERLRVHAEAPLQIAPAERRFRWRSEGEHVLTVDARGLDLSRLRAFSPELKLRGAVDIDLHGSARGGLPTLEGSVDARDLAYDGHRLGELAIAVDLRDRLLVLDGQGHLGAKGALELHARAPLSVDLRVPELAILDRDDGVLSLRVTGIDRELIGAVYELPPELVTYLGFTLTARTGRAGYSGDLAVRGSVAHRDVGAVPVKLDLSVKPTEQRLNLDFGPLRKVGDLHVDVETRADIDALLGGRQAVSEIPLRAAIKTQTLGLMILEPLLPDALYDLKGEVRAEIEADGTIAVPGIRGQLAVVDAAVTVVPLQQRLRRIALEASADGKTIVVDSLAASSGRGTLTGDARLELTPDGYRARAELGLSRFPLVRPGLPQMQITSLLTTEAKSDAEETEIGLKVARTEVSVLGMSGQAADSIPSSDRITYADAKPREPVAEDISPPPGAAAADLEVVPAEPPEDERRFIVEIALADPLEIVGNKLAMRWQGRVRAIDSGETREVVGQLSSKDGFIEFTGNRFTIEQGIVTLPEGAGEIAPFINLTAQTQVRSTQVTLTVRGRLPKPELILESSPAMSQGAILTLLLTGKEEVGEGEEGQVLAAAASLLSAFQNSELRNYVNQRTGIDQIAVTFEDGASRPVLSLGKRLSDDLYVETAMRINPKRGKNRVEARIEYELAPHWTLETSFGDAAVGGIDLFWEKILGNPNNPALRKR